MKKMAFFHLFDDYSGSPKVLSLVLEVLLEVGVDCQVITSNASRGFIQDVKNSDYTFPYFRSKYKIVVLISFIFSQLNLFFLCLFKLRKSDVFVVNTMLPFGACLAGTLLKKQVIVYIHETSIRPKLLKRFLRMCIEMSASKIIFVSNYLKDIESFNNKIEQVVIHNSIKDVPSNERGVIRVEFTCLMACSLKDYKGIKEYILLAENMRADNINFKLILNTSNEEYVSYFKHISIPPNMLICLNVKNMDQYYKESSLLLNLSRPSEWIETFGMTILEGMSFGLPAIVPPVGGPIEIVREGVDGSCISCDELNDVAQFIRALAKDKNLYESYSRSALERASMFGFDIFKLKIQKEFDV